MTDEALRRAINVCIRNAHTAGQLTKGSVQSLQSAQDYAESLLLPIVEARIEQALEEAFAAHRQELAAMPQGAP